MLFGCSPSSQPEDETPDAQTASLDAALVEKGRYLANHVYVCFECHTPRDWNKFSGPPLMGKHGMGGEELSRDHHPGIFYTTNITPYALGNWTDEEIKAAIVSGKDKGGGPLYLGMPFNKYNTMPTEEVDAIVAYLRTIPPVQYDVPSSQPDSGVLEQMRAMLLDPNPQPAPNRGDTLAWGAYLVAAASCEGCHSHVGENGYQPELRFSGGFTFHVPGRRDTVRGANITPHEATGIGKWTKEQFVQRFKYYANPTVYEAATPPGTFNSPMPWAFYAGMTEYDLGAIYAYLRTVPPIEHKVEIFRKME